MIDDDAREPAALEVPTEDVPIELVPVGLGPSLPSLNAKFDIG